MKIAVIGATGAVGREIISDLAESSLKGIELSLFASPRSQGEVLYFGNKSIVVKAFQLSEVRKCDYVLMSAGGAFSREHAQAICADGGPIVIDNSSAWRMQADVPLIVPEVNGDVLKGFQGGIIANPNCAMIQLAVCLKPLHDAFGVDLVQVATFQSVSGSGQKGIKELASQIEAQMKFEDPKSVTYDHPIAFNLIPYIGPISESGYCEEELKIIEELQKVMRLPNLAVLPTTVRVPVYNCHSEAVSVQLTKAVQLDEVRETLKTAASSRYISNLEPKKLPTPRSVVGRKDVSICRLRLMNGQERSNWLQFWTVADNLKKGAATNAVQILEYLVELRQSSHP